MKRPDRCRNELKDNGMPYPKSGCEVCKTGGITGCLYDTKREAISEIAYIVSITDDYGAVYRIQQFDNVEDAIALHEVLDTPEELGNWVMNNFVNIDHYYIDNPYKQFEVLITVEYTND